jgi:integrase
MPLYRKKKSPFWYYTLTIDGQRVRGTTKQKVKSKAQDVLDEQRLKARATGIHSLTRKAPTLEEFSKDFLQWVKDSQSIKAPTKRFYKHAWDMLKVTALASMKLDTISNSDCQTVTFPGGDCHANQALRTFRRMLSLAKEKRLIFGELPKIKTRKVWPRSVAMSLPNAALIASKMPDGDPKDVFLVLRGSGMRPAECYGMRWEFVSLDRAEYQNPNGKTVTAKRSVPLLHDSLSVLQRRHTTQGLPQEGWVFPSDSKSGHVVSINKAFAAARKGAGLPASMVLYTARHGYLTDVAAVRSLAETMKIGGHSDSRTAIGYQHPQTENLQRDLDAARTTGRIQ